MSDKELSNKYVLSFGEDKQIVPGNYVLEPFQEFISEEDYLTKTYPPVGKQNREAYFAKIKEQEKAHYDFINNLDAKQLEKLKDLLA